MADKDTPIGPASNSLSATMGGGSTPKAPKEHKAVEQAEGVVKAAIPSAVLFKRGDLVIDTEYELKVTVLKPYIGLSNTGVPFHEVAHAKSGEKWIQWQTKLKK